MRRLSGTRSRPRGRPRVQARRPWRRRPPRSHDQGFIDEVFTLWQEPLRLRQQLQSAEDTQATGRTRRRFDIIGEVGKAKAVLASSSMPSTGRRVTTTRSSTPGAA